jgi:hypothetical protein
MDNVFRPEVSTSAPRSDLRSELGHILAITRPRSVFDFRRVAVKTGFMSVDFCGALGVQLGHSETFQHAAALDHCLSPTERTITREIHHDLEVVLGPLLWHTV